MENNIRKQVLFVGYKDKFFKQVLENLSENIESFHLEYSSTNLSEVKNKETIYAEFLTRHENIQFHYADFLNNGIDANTLKKLSECRLFFNRTLDRIFLSPLNTRQSDQYFYTLVEFWISYFNKLPGIKKIFFEASPHFPWDICLFFIAKHLNIETFILRRTLINDCVVFDEDFRPSKQRIVKYESSFNGGFELESLLSSYNKESYWLDWAKARTTDEGNLTSAKKSALYFLSNRLVKRIQLIFNDLSNSKKSYFRLSKHNYIFYSVKRFFQQRMLFKYWEENIQKIPDNVSLLYFPLHFQPERSTDPEASFFSQQILAIKLLLKILPKDWQIVIKEHPRQNRAEYPNLRRMHYRSYSEYQDILKLRRVIPVSSTMPSSELLSICRISAACTGSVLWESLLLGKPSISFGTTWHSDCKSSPSIYDIDENPLILSQLLSKDSNQVLRDVEDFIKRNYRAFINSSNSEEFVQQSNLSSNFLASNLSESINYIIENES
tara:strand:- start:72 stop:1556 length:1485 start_codon:yes stop_codon:yes gene_type:complete